MRRATGWAALLVGLALLATTGCGTDRPTPGQAGGTGPGQSTSGNQSASGNQAGSGGAQSGGSAGPGSTGAAGSGAAGSGAVLVDFGRQGGVAGVTDQLVVHEDGTYTLTRVKPAVNRSGRLDSAELADLRAKLASSGFAKLPPVQPGSGTDMYIYHVTYQGTQILAQQAGLADALRPAVTELTAIVERTGS
jgi:hypothetical protein